MIEPPERLPERDAAIDAVLPVVPRLGWTVAALLEAAGPDADLLFADGADMVECWADLADRRMEAEANAMDIAGLRVSERIRAIVALRLEQVRPHRDALRRAAGLLARPSQAALAGRIADRLGYVGLLACEFFATPQGPVFNEMAPRVHNSGHWTIEGAVASQFENHVRAICGLPLGDTALTADGVAMENLIGADVERVPAILAERGAHLHLYGKTRARPGRKMGHVTRLARPPLDGIRRR